MNLTLYIYIVCVTLLRNSFHLRIQEYICVTVPVLCVQTTSSDIRHKLINTGSGQGNGNYSQCFYIMTLHLVTTAEQYQVMVALLSVSLCYTQKFCISNIYCRAWNHSSINWLFVHLIWVIISGGNLFAKVDVSSHPCLLYTSPSPRD